MTQTENTGLASSKQAPPLCVLLPLGLWLEVPDTWSNRRGMMLLLRWWRRADGRPLVTYEHIAQALGYADRRNVQNFWAEFEADSADLAALLQRRKKVEAEVVARCEQIWTAHPLWSNAQVHAECVRRWPAQGARLSEQNIRTAGQQVGFLRRQHALRRQLAEGHSQSHEPVLRAALLDLAHAGAHAQANAARPIRPIPETWEAVCPSGPAQTGRPPEAAIPVAALEGLLLHGEASPSRLAQVWEGATGVILVAFILSDHGGSLEVIGRFCSVHTTTVMRWLSPLAQPAGPGQLAGRSAAGAAVFFRHGGRR